MQAHAKLNLTLDILRRRSDGYHDLRMVMQSIELHDDVRLTIGDCDGIVCRCGDLPGDETNLAYRAADEFFRRTGKSADVCIDIKKRIPVAAGMAGGSADAAAVLRALRTMLCPEMPDSELEALGAVIGSDVPYCIRGGTALAEGRGERLRSLRAAPQFHTVLCKPDFSISTPELFSRVDVSALRIRPDTGGMLAAIERHDASGVLMRVKNVFEEVLAPEQGEVLRIKERLVSLGAEAAAMTGSGPTVFGLFRDEHRAAQAYLALRTAYRQTYLTRFV